MERRGRNDRDEQAQEEERNFKKRTLLWPAARQRVFMAHAFEARTSS